MRLVYSVLLSFVISSSFASNYKTAEADELFKAALGTCKVTFWANFANNYRDDFFKKLEKEDFFSSFLNSKIKEYLKSGNCDATRVQAYLQKTNENFAPLFKKELGKVKDDILKFNNKELDINHLLIKYDSLKKEYGLGDIEDDKAVYSLKDSALKSAQARRLTCTDVVNLNAPLKMNKPKNQDSIGWCYAYAASDLVAHSLGKEPSAIYMALLTNDKFFWKIFGVKEGGFIETPVRALMKQGICLEKDLPSTDYAFSLKAPYNDINTVFNKINEIKEITSKKKIKNASEVKDLLCQNKLQNSLSELFPSLTLDNIAQIIIDSSSSSTFKDISTTSCPIDKNNEELKNLKITTVMSQNGEGVTDSEAAKWNAIDEQLNKGNILGIHYYAQMLNNYHDTGMFANHASSIIGRRFNPKTNSCEYLLRNSWGTSCSAYSDDYDCKDGSVWIGEQFFKYGQSIKEVIYLEKEKV